MIKTYLFTKSGVKQDVPLEDWKSLVVDDCSLLWVDVRSLTKEDLDKLAPLFELHSLALDSVMDAYRRPHLFQFVDHFYVNMTMIKSTRADHGIKPMELHLFVGEKFIITATRENACEAVDKALQEYLDTPSLCERGPMYAVYLLTEDLVETYYPVIEKLDDDADKLEDTMLDRAGRVSLKRNFDLKRRGFELRRLLGPQRDVLNDLSRRDFPFIQGESQVYFQDVYNRMTRLFDMLDTIREILSGNLDIYLSTVSNRLNDIMKVLTIFSVILGIFTLITGWFGMNVFTQGAVVMPLRQLVSWSIGLGLVITGGLLYYFRRIGWL
jgi:magnesium transporter